MEVPFAEDGRLMRVMLELEKILGRVLEEERVVLDSCSRETHSRLLKKCQLFRLRPVRQFLPLRFQQKHQAEMARVDAFLRIWRISHNMRHELMAGQPKCDGLTGFTPQCAAKPLDIESFGRLDIVDRKGQMKQNARFHETILPSCYVKR